VLQLWEMSSALVELAVQLDALGVDIISVRGTRCQRPKVLEALLGVDITSECDDITSECVDITCVATS